MPIAFTIIFDIYPPEKRGKMTGLFGAVFGTSSVFGPLLGAYITEYISWHWVFYINVPIGLLSLIFISVYYKETLGYRKQKIDWWGAVTLVGAVVSLMFALFIVVERRAEEPIISFAMFKKRLFAASNAVALLYGASFIIATIYIPISSPPRSRKPSFGHWSRPKGRQIQSRRESEADGKGTLATNRHKKNRVWRPSSRTLFFFWQQTPSPWPDQVARAQMASETEFPGLIKRCGDELLKPMLSPS